MIDEQTGEITTTTGLGTAELHEMGLVFPKEMEYAEWQEIGQHLQLMSKAMPWWVGDWLNFGEAKYGETYTQAIALTGEKYQTLLNWKSVAKRVPLDVRHPCLSWSAHAEVASLPSEQQAEWLDRVEANSWTREELRKAMRQLPAPEIESSSLPLAGESDEEIPFTDDSPEEESPIEKAWMLVFNATKEKEVATIKSMLLQVLNYLEEVLDKKGA